jgi:hypothetical protein
VLAIVGLVSTWSRVENKKTRQFTIGFAAMNVEMTWIKFAYHAMHKKAAKQDFEETFNTAIVCCMVFRSGCYSAVMFPSWSTV